MSEVKTTELEKTSCPCCDYELDRASSFEGKVPKEGDVSMCIKCGIMLEFDSDGGMIKIKPETLKAVKADKETWNKIVTMQNAINKL